MKPILILSLLFKAILFNGCQNSPGSAVKPRNLDNFGPLEITKYEINNDGGSSNCSIQGKVVDENNEALIGVTVAFQETNIGAVTDLDGFFKIQNVQPGAHTLECRYIGIAPSIVEIELSEGDELKINLTLSAKNNIKLEKPIIYLYPEEKTKVKIELVYDGKLTTTYPKYPEEGWKVQAHPDGTIIDHTGREYYSLYWEGEPKKPLGIQEGFVIPKEETTEFLEEKLEFLGLNHREANEFIIYWLPALEKNNFNLISFAGEDYLRQARLNVSPQPDTKIRICMVFEGMDEAIDFPLQDLTSLHKTRKGFTLVEWGGQQLPKGYALKI